MKSLTSNLRKQLENVCIAARDKAEEAALSALRKRGVDAAEPFPHFSDVDRKSRNRLRAHGRQIGDQLAPDKTQSIELLVQELAYKYWHRMIFARFLAENHLLMHPDGVAVSLEECEELAEGEGCENGWELAASYASRMLPQIFPTDDVVLECGFAPEHRLALEKLLAELPTETFQASDSLGWVYQFWQSRRKDEVNKSGVKIGARELSSVTQLFTEDYMVDFLLDNTLGAWWAGKILTSADLEYAESEDELRKKASLPGVDWSYLRFVRDESVKTADSESDEKVKNEPWRIAAGTFDGWPKSAAELKCLDPCMGSGHFIVAMFDRLVAMRMAEEGLNKADAVAAVIRDNLFGLEIDQRCTQIAAFNLALAAWRRVDFCELPPMNLACSGLAPNADKNEWLALANGNDKLKAGMARLYELFEQGPILGSLINPRAEEGDMFIASFHELQPLLEKALAREIKNETSHELAVTARGLANAAEILSLQFTLVATNVPYLGRGKQDQLIQDYCERFFPEAKADLATSFIVRCLKLCGQSGSTALVTPQSWFFQNTYTKLRRRLLSEVECDLICRLGSGAFETITGAIVNVVLTVFTQRHAKKGNGIHGIDSSNASTPNEKAEVIRFGDIILLRQSDQLLNPDSAISFAHGGNKTYLRDSAGCYQGLTTADDGRWRRQFWEVACVDERWRFLQTPSQDRGLFAGREDIVFHVLVDTDEHTGVIRGREAWGKRGIAIDRVGSLSRAIYDGELFHSLVPVVVPHDPRNLCAIAAFCLSDEFVNVARSANQGLSIDNGYLAKLPFDLEHWQKVSIEKYPRGLPMPFSSDPTQWLFHGNPAGSDKSLHVALARLLGYRWPRQTGSSFPDCPSLEPDGLELLADDDGVLCISAIRGEKPGAERLIEILRTAYGDEWNDGLADKLLVTAGSKPGTTIEDWLRNQFFDQHCKLFHHRPFIWHIWDGRKDGFSCLVNYHKLDHKNLESVTYSYLGDWINLQRGDTNAGKPGADLRLKAAQDLQEKLKLILAGEPPFDIFVRWKPLSGQAIGWNPDLNDGVRMNIRPFVEAGVLRKNPNIKWTKDRGKEPERPADEFPWFWRDGVFTGERINDVHLSTAKKLAARPVQAVASAGGRR